MNHPTKFDTKNKKLISGFLKLMDECYYQENLTLGEIVFNTNKNNFKFIRYHSFYSLFRDICSVPLTNLINEEISNSCDRRSLPQIFEEIITDGHYTPKTKQRNSNTKKEIEHTFNELTILFKYRFNQLLGSQILDFQVCAYSAFESWMTKLYDDLCEEHSKNIEEKRKSKMIKILEDYKKTPLGPPSKKTIDSLFNAHWGFISFQEKINEIYKKIDKTQYKRDINKDKELILFTGKLRNSIHNVGINSGKTLEFVFQDKKLRIEENKPYQTDSWTDHLELIMELVFVYTEILNSSKSKLHTQTPFFYLEHSQETLHIAHLLCNSFIKTEKTPEQEQLFLENLENKTGIDQHKSKKILANLKPIENEFSQGDMIKFLAKDFT